MHRKGFPTCQPDPLVLTVVKSCDQFVPVNQPVICKEGVEFSISERIQRMILWIEENFLLKNSIDNRNSDLGLSFKSKNEFLNLHMNNGRVIIETKV